MSGCMTCITTSPTTWLAEMENWEGHWNNFLYGVYDKEDIGQEDAEPGYEKGNWFTGGSKYGKTTLHYPDQYDYYVKDPGVYTITATIDGCNGVITDQGLEIYRRKRTTC